MAHEHVVAGIATALKVGALTADVVAVEARKAAHTDPQPATSPDSRPRPVGRPVDIPEDIVSLTHRRLATLPVDPRPLPSVTVYDQLLRHRPSATSQGDSA
jgi:hypothetical protein